MEIYLIILFTTLLSMLFLRGKYRKRMGILLLMVMMCICGLRGYDVGTDTHNYWDGYTYINDRVRIEPLFSFYEAFFQLCGFDAHVFLFGIAALSYIPLMLLLKRVSKDMLFSVFIYQSFSVLFFHQTFNAVRQCVAVAFMLWAAYSLFHNKNWKLFLLYSIIGFLFHYSSLAIFLIIVIVRFIGTFNPIWVYVSMVASVVFGYVFTAGFSDVALTLSYYLQDITSESVEHYSDYLSELDNSELNIFGMTVVMLPFSIFAILLYDKKNGQSPYYKLFYIGCFLQNVFLSVQYVYRITMYLTIIITFLLPVTYVRMNQNRKYLVALMSFALVLFYIFSCYTGTEQQRTLAGSVPYYMFFEK